VDGSALAGYQPARRVDRQSVGFERRFLVAHRDARAPELSPDPRPELSRAERFRHVVVGAGVQHHHLLVVRMPRGEDDDRSNGPFADLAAYLRTGEVRKAKVEHDEIRLLRGGEVDSFLAGSGLQHLVPFQLHRVADGATDLGLVIDDEDDV
jgi:hypothetical protein